MCIRCVSKYVKKQIENNYAMNRWEIIDGLYTYVSINETIVNGMTSNPINDKLKLYFNQLKDILTMVERADDETDILIKLEVLEVEMEFLQKEEQVLMDKLLYAYR